MLGSNTGGGVPISVIIRKLVFGRLKEKGVETNYETQLTMERKKVIG